MTPGSWGAQNDDPGLAEGVRQSQVRWERGSEASQVCPKSCQQAGKKRRWRNRKAVKEERTRKGAREKEDGMMEVEEEERRALR